MHNVMSAEPNIGGAIYESSVILFIVPCHKVWRTAAAGVTCSNAANENARLDAVNFPAGKIPLGRHTISDG